MLTLYRIFVSICYIGRSILFLRVWGKFIVECYLYIDDSEDFVY